ncbi:MAG: sugar ABC transporter ATP-binding protein [Armatimonadaceae bacterium]
MPKPLLEMRRISKRFGGVIALQTVSLQVYPGEILALIGENGAGKSTLMKVLGGIHAPDAGEILWNGEVVKIPNPTAANRFGIAFIHQELSVLENLSVAANIFLGREKTTGGPLGLLADREMETQSEAYLKPLGLSLSPRTLVGSLSIAQRQMVEIARALSQNARLIIMDEPSASLTPSETDRLLQVVRDLKTQGVSVIYISHRLREIEAIADRVTGLRDGKNAGDLNRNEYINEITHTRMVRLMVGRDLERSEHSAATTGDTPRLEVRNLRTRRYPEQSVSFSVFPGEVLGFAGLVGAGRTEVAQAIFGVDPPLSGEIILNGNPVPLRSPQDAIRHGIYLIPEDRRGLGLILDMPIRANITLPSLGRFSQIAGIIQRKKEQTAAEQSARHLNVKAPTVEAHAIALSGGNQQKVVLAKWLERNPQVLVFDEPTRGVDVGAKAEIYERIRALAAEEQVAVLCISSDMEEILLLSDRVAVLHEGEITGILSRDELTEEAIMHLAVGGNREVGVV